MSSCIIALKNQPGICPVVSRETCRRLFSKCFLKVTGPETTNVCQDDPLFAGLKEGIYGSIHGIQAICDANLSMENWGFILVDAKRVQQKNRVGML